MLVPWNKSYDQPRQHIKKQRHYFANKSPSSQSYGFSSSWTIKKAECWRIDAFELWCWRRLLRIPWTARRSNHPKGNRPWIFIGRTDAEAETPILWPPNVKNWLLGRPWCWERLKAGGEEDDRGWDDWMASPTRWTQVWISSGSWWTGKPGMLQALGRRVRHDWADMWNFQLLMGLSGCDIRVYQGFTPWRVKEDL